MGSRAVHTRVGNRGLFFFAVTGIYNYRIFKQITYYAWTC